MKLPGLSWSARAAYILALAASAADREDGETGETKRELQGLLTHGLEELVLAGHMTKSDGHYAFVFGEKAPEPGQVEA